MPNNYCTSSDIYRNTPGFTWGTSTDTENVLAEIAGMASRKIDLYTKRVEGYWAPSTDDEIRYFDAPTSGLKARIDDFIAVPTTIEVSEAGDVDSAGSTDGGYTTWANTDILVEPYNAASYGQPFTHLVIDPQNGSKITWFGFRKGLRITGKFGWNATTPAYIKQAAILQSVRWWKRAEQNWQDVGAIEALGQLRQVKALDPDITAMLYEGGVRKVSI